MTLPVNMETLANITFHSCPSNLQQIRRQVRSITAAAGCNEEQVRKLVLVVEEAITNVMRHAYQGELTGEIKLVVARQADVLYFKLRDFADPVDPGCIKPRDLSECRPGGLGVNLIDEVMDSWEFGRPDSGQGNVLTMTKSIERGIDERV
ncbi:MAG: ATP-binding protein [Xanthomonadales bacterium]|nr:ATP-binding protein [Xanthomonadales bacterium]